MSAFVEAALVPEEQPASTHTDAIANARLNTVANLPKLGAQLRNVATVSTRSSAATATPSQTRVSGGRMDARHDAKSIH
ncbi:MAG TPA: hypothetical protein VGC05_18755, partial [Mycobacterium sp.]